LHVLVAGFQLVTRFPISRVAFTWREGSTDVRVYVPPWQSPHERPE
jgi:hypothetical protein